MRFQNLCAFCFSASLLLVSTACVVRSDGGLVFSQGREQAERRESLPLELAAGEQLSVELPYGDIAVRVAEGEAPRVDAHWRAAAADKATAEAVLARYKLELVRGDGSLSVRAVGDPLEVKSGFVTNRIAASVDLTLIVPGRIRLAAKSSSGDLAASGALGSCRLESSYGDLAAKGVRGDTTLETSSGEARVEDIEAQVVEAHSQYGDIGANNIHAANVRLSTSSGEVQACDVQGQLAIKSSYGDLSIENCTGGLDAVTSSGDIEVSVQNEARRKLVTSYGDVHVRGGGGELDAKTSSGSVTVLQGSGSVNAVSSYGDVVVRGRWTRVEASTTSGEVEVQAVAGSIASGPWRISSSYGDASLELPADFSCELRASTSSGDIESEFATKDDRKRHKMERTIGAGGSSVEIKSASGDVTITGGANASKKI